MTQELVIDEHNFHEYFHSVKNNKLQKGQILVRYSAMADFVSSKGKRDLIDLLKMPNKGAAASQVMKNIHHACELDSIRVPLEIAKDLLAGTSEALIMQKPYRYKIEMYYYTWPEYLPGDNHWESISLLNL